MQQNLDFRTASRSTVPRRKLWPSELAGWQTTRDGGPQFPTVFGVRLRGHLDVDALRDALNKLVHRHPSLRTGFVEHDGEAIAVGLDTDRMPVTVIELGSKGVDDSVNRILTERLGKEFDVASEPPMRALLITTDNDEHVLALYGHRLVLDDQTWDLLTAELSKHYQGGGDDAQPVSPVNDEYVAAQEQIFATEAEDYRGFWAHELGDKPLVLDVPSDRLRPSQPSHHTGFVAVEIPPEALDALERHSAEYETSMFTILLAGWAVVLSRHCSTSELVIGAVPPGPEPRTVADRNPTLPLRIDLSGDPTFGTLLTRISETVSRAVRYRDLPVELLVDAPEDGFYQVSFSFSDRPGRRLILPDVQVEELLSDGRRTRLSLDLSLIRDSDRVTGGLRYSTDLFTPESAVRIAARIETLIKSFAAFPDRRLSELEILTDTEQSRITEANRTAAAYPENACFPDLFEQQVIATPDACAVWDRRTVLSYRVLDERANGLAFLLRSRGIGPESPVCVLSDRSTDVLVAFIAVQKVGGTYIPIDHHYPPERIATILRHARPKILVTQRAHAEAHAESCQDIQLLDLTSLEDYRVSVAPKRDIYPDNLAYTIYTSGSSGKPKGVDVTHRGLVNLSSALVWKFDLRGGHRVAMFASLAFDASIWEMTMALSNGSSLYVLDPAGKSPSEAAAELRDAEVSAITLPPAFLSMLDVNELPNVDLLVVAGEHCPDDLVRGWAHQRTFVNAYGPTETTVCATAEQCAQSYGHAPPIGTPLQNITAHVLDGHMRPAPTGVQGELYIGGVALARGYRADARTTAEKFVPDPQRDDGARLYRSGDLVRRLHDGRLRHHGRTDSQLKIRGYRVEPPEVEAALTRHPAVQEAVVAPSGNAHHDLGLNAYIVLDRQLRSQSSGRGPDMGDLQRELHAFLDAILPSFMLPRAYVALERLPLTPNGKVDHAALPSPEEVSESCDAAVEPAEGLEAEIALIWRRRLGLKHVGRDDHFLEIGGHSLVAASVVAEVQEMLSAPIPIRMLFENPILSEFASAAADAAYA